MDQYLECVGNMGRLKHTWNIDIDVQLKMMNEWEVLILEYYLSEQTSLARKYIWNVSKQHIVPMKHS